MGWSYGHNAAGREVGYSVDAVCDNEACSDPIDRGLAHCCGGMHDGGKYGCGGYFCTSHLFLTGNELGESPGVFMCLACCDRWEAAHPAHRIEVDGVFSIRGRGPCITRSMEAMDLALKHGVRFELGDVVGCDDGLEATIIGIERMGERQGGFLLRDVELDELAVGQVWTKRGDG